MPAHFHIVHPTGLCLWRQACKSPSTIQEALRRSHGRDGAWGLRTTRVRSPRKNKNVAFPLQAPANLPWKDEGLRKDMAPPLDALSP